MKTFAWLLLAIWITELVILGIIVYRIKRKDRQIRRSIPDTVPEEWVSS
jgi:hypothetical protein